VLCRQLDFPQGYAYPFVRVNHEVILARHQVRTGLCAVYDRSMSPSVREWHSWLEAKDVPKPRYDCAIASNSLRWMRFSLLVREKIFC